MDSGLLGLIVYFLFGAAGTACRVAISPAPALTFGLNKRTIVEIVVGGVIGFLLPYVGTGLTMWSSSLDLVATVLKDASVPVQVAIKGGLVFVLNYAGSLTIGEILARRKG